MIVTFKGNLGHAGILDYLKLCQPKRSVSRWFCVEPSLLYLLFSDSAFSLLNCKNKSGPGAQMAVCELVPLYHLGEETSTFTAQLMSFEAVFST